jgi:hypothetical protein
MVQKLGSPVCSSVAGASPRAGGVTIASNPAETAELVSQGLAAPAPRHGRGVDGLSLIEKTVEHRAQFFALL